MKLKALKFLKMPLQQQSMVHVVPMVLSWLQQKAEHRQGKPVVTYNGFATLTQVSHLMEKMNAYEFVIATNENRAALPEQIPAFLADEVAYWKANPEGTDWQDVIYRTAIQQSHQVSVSGGSNSGTYYLSANYVDNRE